MSSVSVNDCRDVGEAPMDAMSEEIDSEVYPSEDGTKNAFFLSHCSLFGLLHFWHSVWNGLFYSYQPLIYLLLFSFSFCLFSLAWLCFYFQTRCFARKISAYNCLAVSLFLLVFGFFLFQLFLVDVSFVWFSHKTLFFSLLRLQNLKRLKQQPSSTLPPDPSANSVSKRVTCSRSTLKCRATGGKAPRMAATASSLTSTSCYASG